MILIKNLIVELKNNWWYNNFCCGLKVIVNNFIFFKYKIKWLRLIYDEKLILCNLFLYCNFFGCVLLVYC